MGHEHTSSEESGEEVCTIPDGAKLSNKFYMRRVRRTIGDETFSGTIVDVGRGSISGTLLYTLQYDDKDLEHLDEDQIRQSCRPCAGKGKCKGKGKLSTEQLSKGKASKQSA